MAVLTGFTQLSHSMRRQPTCKEAVGCKARNQAMRGSTPNATARLSSRRAGRRRSTASKLRSTSASHCARGSVALRSCRPSRRSTRGALWPPNAAHPWEGATGRATAPGPALPPPTLPRLVHPELELPGGQALFRIGIVPAAGILRPSQLRLRVGQNSGGAGRQRQHQCRLLSRSLCFVSR